MQDIRPPWAGTSSPLADNDRGEDWILDRDIECAAAEQVEQLSADAWQVQRSHVAENSAFYLQKLGPHARLDTLELSDLPTLPSTSKQELQQAQDQSAPYGGQLATSAPLARGYETSGTGGRPTAIALTDSDVAGWMEIGRRSYHTLGVRPHSRVLSTFSETPYVVGFTHEVITSLGARVIAPGLRNIAGAVEALRTRQADTLLSTPSTAVHLVERLPEAGVDPGDTGVTHLILGGEPGAGPGVARDRLEAAFGAVVTEAMGLGDIAPSLFAECPAQEGMHFSGQGLVWVELIDEAGRPVPLEAGNEGELVYTHLRREAMPLVRFRSRDHVAVTTTSCACGRTGFAIRAVGRTDDMFIVKGVNVYPSAVQAVVTETAPAATGRIRLSRDPGEGDAPPTRIEVEVRTGSEVDASVADALESAVHQRLHFRAEVELVPTEHFGSADYKTNYTAD